MIPKIDVAKAIETSKGMLEAFGPQYVNLACHHLALVEALEKYGWHKVSCPRNIGENAPCACGWYDAARDLLPTKSEGEDEA